MRGWILLVCSSLLQVGWVESLQRTEGFRRFVPLVWYAFFGLTSTWSLARALESIPVGTAYAAWTGLSMIGAVALDVGLRRQAINPVQFACLLAVLGGTAGLRIFTTPQAPVP